ncbi:hypothetical protein EYW49_18555 [Siculibacillus lacustris]|uniref:Uncharacterized protein n=1 Tax=Siculibacillus lacustris TaxID=1549641 RepID=A0A4Q9VGW6_9HYPH|nr:hypothetical protein [Siculibacillus lacustris]TBW34287.1 hypothetical protein EYW49_18555 [Siculibacillus lacustris]
MGNLIWKIRQNETFNKAEALYAIQDGVVGVIIPLHDPRDGNWDGTVSTAEWAIGGLMGLNSVLSNAQMARLMKSISLDESDVELYQASEQQFARALVVAVEWGFKKAYVEVWAGAVGKIATAGLVNLPITQFFVRKSLEAAIKRSYDAAVATLH